MHGGVKVYRGAPAAARNYLEADRSRADDYYLAEGTGIARRFTASADAPVVELASLTGDGYEAWVAGVDPETGVPRGRLRTDARAVRFVEVTVNGPKSWSLAAELHPEIAAAYEAAQDRAAEQVIGWLGQHATARVGPRGGQVAVPVQRLEAVTVRHYTSRAGDPHRHLHLQVNARVFAVGRWRGLDTVAVRDQLAALNGIGHAAVACDPEFRAALAAHGHTLTPSGEIAQLAPYVGAFSKRARQIERHLDRYESQWRAQHPGEEPGPALRRAWDARAWAENRPDKVSPAPGVELRGRWLDELARLGYCDPRTAVELTTIRVGELDRDQVVEAVLATVGARRSAWNAADVRGEIDQHLAAHNVVADPAARVELAEDLTARAVQNCVPLLDRSGVPEHIRALTSARVLDVEADLVGRLAARAAVPSLARQRVDADDVAARARTVAPDLDVGQAAAVAALASDGPLVVIEGAAGAGKTTLLAAARAQLTDNGRRMTVVTPTLKAAQAAQAELGAATSSAARLAYGHGWRWDQHGSWTRLRPGDTDPTTGRVFTGPPPESALHAGDLLVVDEAGMLDQDTATALLTLADEHQLRVALIGDRHQLAAVGRGGVLDHAARWSEPISVDVVHRFVRTVPTDRGHRLVPDTDYAELTRVMRTGDNPEALFDALHARDQIRVHATTAESYAAIADAVVADRQASRETSVVAATREQVGELNAVIREHLIHAGLVHDDNTVTTSAGERIGVGDRVATRRNDRDLSVANRDTWTVTHVGDDGTLGVTHPVTGRRVLPAGYVSHDVELGYASTAHGAQGSTTHTAHLLLDEHCSAAGAYVAMTRGRHANTAHLVAAEDADAREQWVATFGRDRADLGPAAACDAAGHDASRYAPPRPIEQVIAELRDAWDQQADAQLVVHRLGPVLERAVVAEPRVAAEQAARDAASARVDDARRDLDRARDQLSATERAIEATRTQLADQLHAAWDAQRADAQADARRIQAGTGRFGRGRTEISAATERLEQWATTWAPVVGDLHERFGGLVGFAAAHPGNDHIGQHLRDYALRQAHAAHPEHADHTDTLSRAREQSRAAHDALRQASRQHLPGGHREDHLATPASIERLRELLDTSERQLASADQRLTALRADPAVTSRPDSATWLATQHASWRADRTRREADDRARHAAQNAHLDPTRPQHTWQAVPATRGPSISR
jgi:exodeoxyribonuclease V alpha subunit